MRRLAALALLLALAGAGIAASPPPRAAFVSTGDGSTAVAFDRAETLAGVPGTDEAAVAEAYGAALRRALARPAQAVLEVSTLLAADAAEVTVRVHGAANATVEATLVSRSTFAVHTLAPPVREAHGDVRFRFGVAPRDAPALAVVAVATGADGAVLQTAVHALDDDGTTRAEARVVLVERLGPATCDGCGTVDAALARLDREHGLASGSGRAEFAGYLGPIDPVRLGAGLALGVLFAAVFFAVGRRPA